MADIREIKPSVDLHQECVDVLAEVLLEATEGEISMKGILIGGVDAEGNIYQFSNESLRTDGALVIAQILSHMQLNQMAGGEE